MGLNLVASELEWKSCFVAVVVVENDRTISKLMCVLDPQGY